MRKSRSRHLDGTQIKRVRSTNTNKSIRQYRRKGAVFVGLDVHKETVQVAAVDNAGKLLFNKKISSRFDAMSRIAATIPKNAKYVMESSSVWYGLYMHMTDTLNLDVTVSNPYNTKIIAASLKKTDKIDAFHLANLLRGGYIATCYVAEPRIMDYKRLVRHRYKLVHIKTKMKNFIHGITLQQGIRSKVKKSFSNAHIDELKKLKDYRINSYLNSIEFHEKEIAESNMMINRIARENDNVRLLVSIPGVGPYTALAIYSEIAEIGRFSNSHELCAYAGIVQSVRNSADTVHHGRITKRGSSMMRWLLVETIHTHVRYAPDSDITKFYKRLAKKRGTSKAAVAAASKMLRVIYWMLKEKREFVTCQN